MAQLTTSYNSDKSGNLLDLATKYRLDKLIAKPVFSVTNGYYLTGMLNGQQVTVRFDTTNGRTIDELIEVTVEKIAKRLQESQ